MALQSILKIDLDLVFLPILVTSLRMYSVIGTLFYMNYVRKQIFVKYGRHVLRYTELLGSRDCFY